MDHVQNPWIDLHHYPSPKLITLVQVVLNLIGRQTYLI